MTKLNMDPTILIIVVIAFAVGFLAPKLTHKNDGVIEQSAEAVIEREMGIDYDFSPDTPLDA